MEKNVSLGKQLQFVNLKRLVLTLFLFPPPAPSPERLGRWGRGTLVEVRGGSAATAREERAKPLPAQPRSLKAAEPPCPSERRAGPLGRARDSQDCSSKKTGGGVTTRPTELLLRGRTAGVGTGPAGRPRRALPPGGGPGRTGGVRRERLRSPLPRVTRSRQRTWAQL